MSFPLVWVRPAESSRVMTNTTQTMTLKTASRGLGIVHRLASQLFTAARLARAPPFFLGQLLQRNHRFESVEPTSTFPHTVTEFPLQSFRPEAWCSLLLCGVSRTIRTLPYVGKLHPNEVPV